MKLCTKKSIFVWITAFLFTINSNAQNNSYNPCHFDEYTNNKSIKTIESIIQKGVEKLKNTSINRDSQDSVKTIPVVVHVFHIGGSENISDEQIQSQIKIINEDFRKIAGSNGDGNGVDTKLQFCLAKIDPNEHCTNGIVRVHSSLTYHQTYERSLLKQVSFWDNTRYLNIYLVKTISGNVLGYSSFPGGPPDEDGMVIKSKVFGNTGTASSSLGRTASHEIGHWLGLYHTFNNGCGTNLCSDGDFVCDTPPQASPSFNCNTINSCSNDIPDVDDQKENYMNYTPDACKNMFTNGQKLRIHTTLDSIRTIIWSQENLLATGCDSNFTAPTICEVRANFVTLTPDICVSNTVDFMDISLNNANSWQWTFEGGIPATSNIQNPSISYNDLGSYSVKLVVSDGSTTDSFTINNYISVSSPGVGSMLPFYEDFESGTFPPQGTNINNLDGGITWGLDSAAAFTGDYSIKIDNYINTNYGSIDEIVLPYLDLSSNSSSDLYMTFNWAYARSDASFSDEMSVQISTDCGSNYLQKFYRSGNALVTGPTQTTPFIPDSTQWKKAIVFLDSYNTETYVQIKIVNITDGGNNLYIDNIQIGDFPSSIENQKERITFSFHPNPASDNIVLNFSESIETRIIKVYNTMGNLVHIKDIGNSSTSTLSTKGLVSGIYYLQVTGNNTQSTEKLIISK